jgi:hypothetical protein
MRLPLLLCLLLATACGKDSTDTDPDDRETDDPELPDTDVADTDDTDVEDTEDTEVADTDVPDTDVPDTDDTDLPPLPNDQDRDGSPLGVDCDDLDPTRTPGAEELCDGIDNNCDGDSRDLGAASWLPSLGAAVPLTNHLATGTATAPAFQPFASSGTLLLCEGSWHASIGVDNNAVVTVRGVTTRAADVVLNGAGSTTIVASGGSSAVHLRDLTLTGAPSCLVVFADSANSLTNVILNGCSIRTDARDATLTLTDTELNGASATLPGLSGIWTSVTLLRADVHHYTQGGLVFGTTGDVELLQSDVHDNQSPGDGGGVSLNLNSAVSPVSITMTGTTVQRNHADLRGGGLYLQKPDALAVTLDGGLVRANTSVFGAEGVFLHQPGVTVSNLTLSDHADNAALMGYLTGAWSNITCIDNGSDCLYTLGGATPRSWTLSDSTLHRNGRYTINLSDSYTLTLTNVDFGAGPDANFADVYFDGATHDYQGTISGSCTLATGCD